MTVNWASDLWLEFRSVQRVAKCIENMTKYLIANRDRNRPTSVGNDCTASKTVCWLHRNCTDHTVANMLLDF